MILSASAALAFFSCQTPTGGPDTVASKYDIPVIVMLDSEMDRMSYAMGVTYGRQFWLMGVAVDQESFVKGYVDWKEGKSEVAQGQIQSALSQLEQALGARGGKPFSFEAPYLGQGKRLSYIVGASLASQVIQQRYEFLTQSLLRGCLDVFAGADDTQLLLSPEAITDLMLVIPQRARPPVDTMQEAGQ